MNCEFFVSNRRHHLFLISTPPGEARRKDVEFLLNWLQCEDRLILTNDDYHDPNHTEPMTKHAVVHFLNHVNESLKDHRRRVKEITPANCRCDSFMIWPDYDIKEKEYYEGKPGYEEMKAKNPRTWLVDGNDKEAVKQAKEEVDKCNCSRFPYRKQHLLLVEISDPSDLECSVIQQLAGSHRHYFLNVIVICNIQIPRYLKWNASCVIGIDGMPEPLELE